MKTKTLHRKQIGGIELVFDAARGCYHLRWPRFQLNNCRSALRLNNGAVKFLRWKVEREDGARLCLSSLAPNPGWRLVFSPALAPDGTAGIRIDMVGHVPAGLRSAEAIVLRAPSFQADHILAHARTLSGCASWKLPVREHRTFTSSYQQMITSGNVTLQISHPLKQNHLSTISGEVEGRRVSGLTVASRAEFPAAGRLRAEPATLRVAEQGLPLMVRWAEDERNPRRHFQDEPAGWNSWDYYRWTITEDEVLKNAEFIRKDPVLRKHVKRIIIDDGWQYCYGEWEANPLFPSGMQKLATRLARMGFEPGIWIAPTIIEPHCRIAQWDTDMLAMSESGMPCLAYECMKRVGFVLDPTRERVRRWLHDLFARYTREGYRYFKLDFLWLTLKAPRFFLNHTPRGRIMDMIIRPIWEAVRGRARIMACSNYFDCGNYINAMRISSDCHAVWDQVKNNVIPQAARFWGHRRLWISDPDFALCRGWDTSNDPDLQRLRACLVSVKPGDRVFNAHHDFRLADLRYEEAKVLLSLVVISGGCVNLSDKLTVLNERGLDLLRRTVAVEPGEAGVPLDLLKSDRPSLWLQKTRHGHRLLLVNWKDKPDSLRFDLAAHGVRRTRAKDFWTDRLLDLPSGKIELTLPAHACRLLEL